MLLYFVILLLLLPMSDSLVRLIEFGLHPVAIRRVVSIVPVLKFPSSVAIATALLTSMDPLLLLLVTLLLLFLVLSLCRWF
jgi:hypothetical protein